MNAIVDVKKIQKTSPKQKAKKDKQLSAASQETKKIAKFCLR